MLCILLYFPCTFVSVCGSTAKRMHKTKPAINVLNANPLWPKIIKKLLGFILNILPEITNCNIYGAYVSRKDYIKMGLFWSCLSIFISKFSQKRCRIGGVVPHKYLQNNPTRLMIEVQSGIDIFPQVRKMAYLYHQTLIY